MVSQFTMNGGVFFWFRLSLVLLLSQKRETLVLSIFGHRAPRILSFWEETMKAGVACILILLGVMGTTIEAAAEPESNTSL
jgi:hypothetical protein